MNVEYIGLHNPNSVDAESLDVETWFLDKDGDVIVKGDKDQYICFPKRSRPVVLDYKPSVHQVIDKPKRILLDFS